MLIDSYCVVTVLLFMTYEKNVVTSLSELFDGYKTMHTIDKSTKRAAIDLSHDSQ